MSTSISPPLSRDARGPVDIACRPGAVAETQTETETFRRHCGIIADLAPAYRARGMDQEVFEWVACAALRQAIRTFTGDSRDFPAYATTAIVTRVR